MGCAEARSRPRVRGVAGRGCTQGDSAESVPSDLEAVPRCAASEARLSNATRILLIEDLDALGADVVDARERAGRLKAATGGAVTWLAVAPPGTPISPDDAGSKSGRLVTRQEAAPALRGLLAERWDRILLASASPGGGSLTRWLPVEALWWPTGLEPSSPRREWARIAGRARGERALAPLDRVDAWGAGWLFGWAQAEPAAARRPGLPLWDGDLVLALEGFAGVNGARVLAAFARLAEDWTGLDLVGWSHPVPDVERRAQSSGIGIRVHQVGPPPRLAESSWLSQASAAVLMGQSRISAGLVLRALAAGCPLLWVAPPPPASGLARWLVERGCAALAPAEPRAIAEALDSLIERGPAVEAAVERGRALAARHDRHALIDRLAGPLGRARSVPRAA